MVEELGNLLGSLVAAFVLRRHPYLACFFQDFLPNCVRASVQSPHCSRSWVLSLYFFALAQRTVLQMFSLTGSISVTRFTPVCTGVLQWRSLLALMAGATLPAWAQSPATPDHPLSERRVHYHIEAELDEVLHDVHGTVRMEWRNPDAVPVSSLRLHLYLNAFRSSETTFMRESGGRHRGFEAREMRGGMDMEQVSVTLDGSWVDVSDSLQYIQPDDGNVHDSTLAVLRLPFPVPPNEVLLLSATFTSRLPEIVARTGYLLRADGQPFFMVAQWFPKLAVYEVPGQRYVPRSAERGQWNAYQFHANSEFYADFGTYDVLLDVPATYTTGATGHRVSEQTAGRRKRLRYIAEDVHDFAWTTSPAFLTVTDRWQHVELHLLLLPEHRRQARRYLEAAKEALSAYTAMLGPYPYAKLTVVDGMGGANGMEYPMLVTGGTAFGIPRWLRVPELVLIHEIGHQYFYGLVATNEVEEAWLDEGFASYVEAKVMDRLYGRGSVVNIPGLFRLGDAEMHRLSYAKMYPRGGALQTVSWRYRDAATYAAASYSKASTVLRTLEGWLGWDTMQEVLRLYVERWSFRHPAARDFEAIAEEVSGQDLAWFFEQYVRGEEEVDYAIAAIDSAEVRLERLGTGTFPQTLRVTLADGSIQEREWDGVSLQHRMGFDQAVVEAYLDPENKIWLDTNRLNNRRRVSESDFTWSLGAVLLVWMQRILMLGGM